MTSLLFSLALTHTSLVAARAAWTAFEQVGDPAKPLSRRAGLVALILASAAGAAATMVAGLSVWM